MEDHKRLTIKSLKPSRSLNFLNREYLSSKLSLSNRHSTPPKHPPNPPPTITVSNQTTPPLLRPNLKEDPSTPPEPPKEPKRNSFVSFVDSISSNTSSKASSRKLTKKRPASTAMASSSSTNVLEDNPEYATANFVGGMVAREERAEVEALKNLDPVRSIVGKEQRAGVEAVKNLDPVRNEERQVKREYEVKVREDRERTEQLDKKFRAEEVCEEESEKRKGRQF
ncbi:hypothetical protein BU24DRAFT_464982 [Aaosphaeria arxii CBS 175.79]|uniref:Uncharacterized protein n=1 Tax=Aaosphaeria arxii CBS 175.79 TaxID=1450172 RepID=A0A6A5XIF3_9PLEO|nr:uncharacterized protein BU24DRAFT_464982 [Aaosphaeria arxii CBS 175.79]KAF2012607.1 hypothetical protein BU24DRAFT_464982 [Aaosphaeria arxii CBS 175.79]